jgi:hypothetical protein
MSCCRNSSSDLDHENSCSKFHQQAKHCVLEIENIRLKLNGVALERVRRINMIVLQQHYLGWFVYAILSDLQQIKIAVCTVLCNQE